jgi:hypothetical protein
MAVLRKGSPKLGIRAPYLNNSPPPGRTVEQDAHTLRTMLEHGIPPNEIEAQILGLSLMREEGKIPKVGPDTAFSTGLLYVTGFGVRPLANQAADAYRQHLEENSGGSR